MIKLLKRTGKAINQFFLQSITVPELVIKSTFGTMLSSLILIIPFAVNNLINNRYLIGVLCIIIAGLSLMSARASSKGGYSWGINLFSITPIVLIVIPLITLKLGIVGTYWAFLAVVAFYLILTERIAWIINTLFVLIMMPVSWGVIAPEIFVRFAIMLVVTSAFAAIFIRIINDQHSLLVKHAVTDPMTGVYNRSLLQASLERAIHQYQRKGIQMSIIIMDIDNFKLINDEFGHDQGDRVIKSIGKLLLKSFRSTDKIFRLGGEEFLILALDTNMQKAYDIAEKLRADIEGKSLIAEKRVTVSIGVSEVQKDQSWGQWMKHCDENLYRAKSKGRNIVVS